MVAVGRTHSCDQLLIDGSNKPFARVTSEHHLCSLTSLHPCAVAIPSACVSLTYTWPLDKRLKSPKCKYNVNVRRHAYASLTACHTKAQEGRNKERMKEGEGNRQRVVQTQLWGSRRGREMEEEG